MKRFFKILGSALLVILLLMVIAVWMVSTEKYQNILVQKGAKYLSEKLHTKVEVKHVRLSFFNHFNLEGVYVEDKFQDTLAYIGTLQLNTSELLSNYWNDSPPIIKTITLENTYINLNRKKDSIWNYDFIAEAFSSKSTNDTLSSAPETETKKSSTPEIDLKNLTLKNIRFYMNDGWRGEDMNFAFQKLILNTDNIDLPKKIISLKELLIEGADIAVREYDGYKPEDLSPDDTTDWGTPFNPDHFKLTLNNLELQHSRFSYRSGNEISKPAEFDEKNIIANDINLFLNNTKVDGDTIFAQLKNLNATERCGVAIKEMSANVKFSQIQARLSELKLVTNYSVLTDYYEMNYKNFHDFNDYIAKVNMKARLKNTKVSSIDIGYFANILNQYPISINAEGEVDGTVDNIHGKNISLQTLNTSFKGDASVIGLPDVDNTLFDVTGINLITSGKDLNALIPQTRTNNIAWNKLASIQYTGSYKGKVDKFYTKGNLNTSLGNALLDLDMNFQPKQTSYAGNIETENFDIGSLVRQTTFGKISMKGTVNGSGFDLENLNAKINATVSKIELDKSIYTNLTINGLVENKKFDGIFISQDPGLAVNFNGKLDLSGNQPSYKFTSRFLHIDFQKLGLSKEPMTGSGYASLNFTGSTIDDFTGTASMKNVMLEKNGKTISLANVTLQSYKELNTKTLKLTSSIADAELIGDFSLSGLPKAIQLYLYHYLPQYIKKPTDFTNQELAYNITIKNCDTVLQTFLPDYKGISGSVISGVLNTKSQKFSLDANIPSFGYQLFDFKNLILVGAGDYTELDLNATCGNFLYNENVIIPSFQVNALMASDTASLSIVTQSINELLGDAHLNLKATALDNNLFVSILPSNITVKDDIWQLYSNDDLVIGKKIKIQNLIVESGAQKISVNTTNTDENDVAIDLSELDLQNFSDYLNQTKPSFSGRVSGKVTVKDFINNPVIEANIYSTTDVSMDNDTIGLVNMTCAIDLKNKMLNIAKNTNLVHGEAVTNIEGSINLKDSTIRLSTNLSKTNIAVVNQFISDYVKDLKGSASGKVDITGQLSNPKVSGIIDLENSSLKVLYLGTTYYIKKAKLNFNDSKINVEDFPVYDERGENYSGIVKGYLTHKNFSNFQLYLNISSDNLLCLNTMEWDNNLFYGYMPAEINAKVRGHLDDITLDIETKPLKGANFHMPISSTGDASTYDYIEFVQIGKNQEEEKKKHTNYFKINMNIEATPDAEVHIILDKNTREEISAKGNGNINLNFDMGNSMNMFGTYSITEGKYLFNFRGVLPRVFTIDEGSTIRWNGDPLDAKLDVTAIYKLDKPLPLYPLIAGLLADETEIAEAKKTYETFVTLYLKNELSNPDIKFDITQPNNKAIGTLAYDKLVQIKNDEKELVSQAGVLLLLGEFKGSDKIGTGSVSRGGVATASDLIGNALSSGLTNVFSEVTGLKNISLNVGYKTYSMSAEQANINQFNFGVTANLFKDRVVVDVGSNLDVDRNPTAGKTTNGVNIGGDVKAQYLVTDDGRFRINAFSSSNPNLEGTNITKGGVGFSYKKVFNSLHDLFTSKKKKYKIKSSDSLDKS